MRKSPCFGRWGLQPPRELRGLCGKLRALSYRFLCNSVRIGLLCTAAFDPLRRKRGSLQAVLLAPLARPQKRNFMANCITRGSLAFRTCPKVESVKFPSGFSNCVWFQAL